MKDLNLLPSDIRYDYEKQFFIKVLSYFLVLNVLFVSIIAVNEYLEIRSLNRLKAEKAAYLNEIQNINSQFETYVQQHAELKQHLVSLKEKEKTFFSYFKLTYSPLISTIIHLDSITMGVYVDRVEYRDGGFVVEGTADKSTYFYDYYKSLENSRFISSLDFHNLTADDKGAGFTFKVEFKTRSLDETL